MIDNSASELDINQEIGHNNIMVLFRNKSDQPGSHTNGNHRRATPETSKKSLVDFVEDIQPTISGNLHIQLQEVFQAIEKAIPSCKDVISVQNIHPVRTQSAVFLVTVGTDHGPRKFVCKIPGALPQANIMEASLHLRKHLQSPMLPHLYQVIHARNICSSDPNLPVPIVIEEYIPHRHTVENDMIDDMKNPAVYLDSLVFSSLHLFKEAAKQGATLNDNIGRNIAVLDGREPQFIYFDMGQLGSLQHDRNTMYKVSSIDSFQKMIRALLETVQAVKKKIPNSTEHNMLIQQIDQWITEVEATLHEKSKISIYKPEDAVEKIRSYTHLYRRMRTSSGGPKLHIAYTTPREIDPVFMTHSIGSRLRKIVGL